ncbi:MAG: molecular chaperone HtpG [Clostridiales Family XIII bacterium]|jgi:molecular chaperone HtpG|nr:molecular chaperone HtpG [Clostridiales Family XIII bacterium]
MAIKEFKAESRKLLNLMINSIYTHKEIFLRELISNASDSIDKLYYKSLTEKKIGIKREDFFIRIIPNKEDKTLTIFDNGIGMGRDELEKNLGIIAKSGSLNFKRDDAVAKEKDIDIIGQFGVGFYSAFMVSKKIEVYSRAYGNEEIYLWKSEGVDGFEIKKVTEKDADIPYGTDSFAKIILWLKDDMKDSKYSSYLEEYEIKNLVKKYSDYIRFPIKMEIKKTKTLEKKDENDKPITEEYTDDETLNSMVPIWKKAKKDVKKDEYNNFYKEKFFDYENPLKIISSSVEGAVNYSALLFIPKRPSFDYYTKEYEKGLALYSSGVMIMEKCKELIPDYFSFVKGVVDSDNLSLNISRELLQHDRQLLAIELRIEKKIEQELMKMQKNSREDYEIFFKNFGLQIKYGIYDKYGQNKEKLKELLLYYSSKEKKMTTLKEYIERMPEKQEFIYYAISDSIEKADKLPGAENLKDKKFEILYMTDDLDDFVMKILDEYDGKKFKSVTDADLGIKESKKEKEENKKLAEENKTLLEEIKVALGNKVKEVKLSSRLKNTPVVLVSGEGMSLEMEKVLQKQHSANLGNNEFKAEKILEINPNHKFFEKLKKSVKDKEKLAKLANVLYNQALLIGGMPIEDPVEFARNIADVI